MNFELRRNFNPQHGFHIVCRKMGSLHALASLTLVHDFLVLRTHILIILFAHAI